MRDDEIKGLFYSYGQYVSGKDYALIRAIEKVIAPQHTEQKPVIDKSAAIRIATALGWEPKREWVGLKDEEIQNIAFDAADRESAIIQAESKLKQKNGY